jgi:uncharacterized protein YukE
MFGFFKKFFKKEAETVTIKTAEAAGWLEAKKKEYSSELITYAKDKSGHLEAVKKELRNAVKELEEAEIEDEDKIQPKIKSVVTAARRDYARDIERLVSELSLDTNDEDYVLNSCRLMQEKLNLFSKKTAKEYFRTQHLFHKPLENIAEQLKELGKVIKELNEHAEKSKVFMAKEAMKSAAKLNDDIALLDRFKNSIEALEQQRKEKEDAVKRMQDETDRLISSQAYSEYKGDVEKLGNLKHESRLKSDEIYALLAQLQSALKRYLRVALENLELLSRYINDPVRALADDNELVIMSILSKVKDIVERGDLELKDDKKKKMINVITSISADKLNKLRSGYIETETAIEGLRKKIESNTAQAEHEDMLKKKGKIEDELKAVEREIDDTKNKINKIEIEKDRQQTEKKMRELTGIEVVLE